MNTRDESEIKKEFQLERVILFTDAVFAIIITIMVLDLRLPEGLHEATSGQLNHAFIGLVPKFFAYVISFFLVSRFWVSHLKIFAFLKDYNIMLIFYNLLFLFCVSLFPLAVSLISGNVSIKAPQYSWCFYIYVSIIFSTLYAQTLLVRYLVKHKEQLCFAPAIIEQKLKWKTLSFNLYFIPLIILLMGVLNYFTLPVYTGVYLYLIYMAIIRRLTKKYYPENDENSGTSFLKNVFIRVSKRKLKQPKN